MTNPTRSLVLAAGCVVFGVLLVHLPALRTGYAYDDVEAILENEDLMHWESAPALLQTNYWGSRNIGLYRPLVQMSYLVDGAGFSFDARVSHGIQIVLHVTVVLLLLVWLVRLGIGVGEASAVALLFGVHPALLDASVWISGRTDVLSALFMLAGLLLARAAGERGEGFFGWRTVALGVVYLLGLLSKEMAVTLPLIVLVMPGARPWRRLPVLGIAFVVYLALRWNAVPGVLPSYVGDGEGVVLADQNVIERLLIGGRACLRLLALLFVPVGLAADHQAHPFAQRDVTLGVTGFLTLLALLLWATLAWRHRRRGGVEGFLAAAGLLSLLPILQIIPIGAVMAERFLYTPALFLLPLAARLLARILPAMRPRRAVALAAIVLAVVLTEIRIPVYEHRGTYSADVLRAYPNDWKAWNNLGVYRFLPLEGYESHAPDFAGADAAFTEALALRPGYRRGILNQARVALERQRLETPDLSFDDVEVSLDSLATRDDPDALYLLGKVSWRTARRTQDDGARRESLERAYARHRQAALGFERDGRGGRRAAAAWKEAGLAAKDLSDVERWRDAWRRALDHDRGLIGAAAMERELREAEGR